MLFISSLNSKNIKPLDTPLLHAYYTRQPAAVSQHHGWLIERCHPNLSEKRM